MALESLLTIWTDSAEASGIMATSELRTRDWQGEPGTGRVNQGCRNNNQKAWLGDRFAMLILRMLVKSLVCFPGSVYFFVTIKY